MVFPFECPVCGHKTNMPKTNADRIRAMSDEKLADFMIGVAQRGGKPTNQTAIRWLDWLKQEAGE